MRTTKTYFTGSGDTWASCTGTPLPLVVVIAAYILGNKPQEVNAVLNGKTAIH